MKIKELFENVKYRAIGDIDEVDIMGLSCDTANIQEGNAFFCLKGTNTDGHNFADIAKSKGATLLVCEHPLDIDLPQIVVDECRLIMPIIAGNFYHHPQEKLKLIGVTGTNGKTTTTYMIQSILKTAGKKVGVIGTIGIVVDNITKPAILTTPDPIELHSILAEMVNAGVEVVVMEVSAHAIALHKMAGIIFDIGILTNVTQDHLDFFKTFENYAKTKRAFINPNFCKIGVINIDDKIGKSVYLNKERINNNFELATFGLQNPSDVFCPEYSFNLSGTKYILNLFDDVLSIDTKLIGKFNLYNALGASTASYLLGIAPEKISEGLNKMEFVPGRFNVINLSNGTTAIVDYAHTPDGLLNILTAVRNITDKKIISVFGCGGNRDSGKRPIMGEISGENADFTIITSDNPRLENPEEIISQVENGVRNVTQKYLCITDRRSAIRYALGILDKGDVAVISGKGAENYIDMNGVKYPYNDTETIMEEYENIAKTEAKKW